MKIAFAHNPGQKGTISILVDGDVWREVHATIFGRKLSLPKECNDFEELRSLVLNIEYKGALNYTLRRISQRIQLTDEIRKSLNQYLVSEFVQEKIIAECKRLGYLNDDEWLDSFIRGQLSKRTGPHKILLKLRIKGISMDKAKETLTKYINPEGQQEQITYLLKTRFRNRDLSNYHSREKVIAALIRKGYEFQEIKEAISHSNN